MKYYIKFPIVILIALFIFNTSCQNVDGKNTILEKEASLLAVLSVADSTALSDEKVNVLEIFLVLNDDDAPLPSKDFATGPVEKNRDPITIQKTEDVYIASLPGDFHIPSPSVYNGTVYVSGGFGSMEYFALDAKTRDRK